MPCHRIGINHYDNSESEEDFKQIIGYNIFRQRRHMACYMEDGREEEMTREEEPVKLLS